MELPASVENISYSLDINHRAALYNFKTVGLNFEMKTTIFSYLTNDYPLIIQKQLINEFWILQRILDSNKAGIVLAETDDSADEKIEIKDLNEKNLNYCESNLTLKYLILPIQY